MSNVEMLVGRHPILSVKSNVNVNYVRKKVESHILHIELSLRLYHLDYVRATSAAGWRYNIIDWLSYPHPLLLLLR